MAEGEKKGPVKAKKALNLKGRYIVAILVAIVLIILDFFFFSDTPWFVPLIVLAFIVAWMQRWIDFFMERQRLKAIENNFPDFVRNLVAAVKSGMPFSKSIQHIASRNYGNLTPYVRKMARQIGWGLPVHDSLMRFAYATRSSIVKRAMSTVIEAEGSGGNMEDVLNTITESLLKIKDIKDKRKALVQSQMAQSYIIFFVFLATMIIVQNVVIPAIVGDGGIGAFGDEGSAVIGAASAMTQKVTLDLSSIPALFGSILAWLTSLYGILLMISLIQGFFAGIVLGKMAEGDMTSGLKHSLVLMTIAFIALSVAQGLL